MIGKARRILSLVLSLGLLFQQIGFAQVATELNIANHLARMASSFTVDKFRPVHLRYFSYDSLTDNFKVLLDKGDLDKGLSPKGTVPEQKLQEETKTLLSYFLIGVTLPDTMFWVNLRPDSEDQIIDSYLEKTDVGKIMLEADLQLKKDTALYTSPQTPEGKEYWNRLYKKAAEIFSNENIEIPTLTRPWIVPGEIIVRESKDSAYVYKATLKVMLEQDYLKDSTAYNFKDERSKALNEYSSQLIRELIIPKLTKEVNSSKRYAPLRQVYYSLILSRWFKLRFTGKTGTYASLINTKDLTNLVSQEAWSKTDYFKQYQKSFSQGEYNIKEPVYTPTGQVIRSYFSGGINVASSAINTQNGFILANDNAGKLGDVVSGKAIVDPRSINLQRAVAASPIKTSVVESVSSPITSLSEKIGDRVMIKGREALILGVDSEGKGFDYIFIDSYRSGLHEEKGEWSDIQEVIPPRYAPEFPFNPGDKVEVKYKGVWQKGTLVQAAGGGYEIVTYARVHNNMDYSAGRGLTTSYFSDTEEALSYGLRKAKKEKVAGVGETAIVENPAEEVSAPPIITSLSVKTWSQDIGKSLLDIIRHFAKTEKEAADTKEAEVIREFRSILEQAIAASDESFKSLLVQALKQLLNHPELIRKMTLVNMLGQIQAYPGFTDIFHVAANEMRYTDAMIHYDSYETVTGLAKPNLSKAQSSKEKIQLIEFLEPESYRNMPIDQARWFESSETVRSRMSEAISLMNSPLLDVHWSHPKTGIETSYVRAALILRLFLYIQKAIEEGIIVPGLLKGSPLLLEDSTQPPVASSPIKTSDDKSASSPINYADAKIAFEGPYFMNINPAVFNSPPVLKANQYELTGERNNFPEPDGSLSSRFGYKDPKGALRIDNRREIMDWVNKRKSEGSKVMLHFGIGGQGMSNSVQAEYWGTDKNARVIVMDRLGVNMRKLFEDLLDQGYKASEIILDVSSKSGTTDEPLSLFQDALNKFLYFVALENGMSIDAARRLGDEFVNFLKDVNKGKDAKNDIFFTPMPVNDFLRRFNDQEREIIGEVFKRMIFTTSRNVKASRLFAFAQGMKELRVADIAVFDFSEYTGGRFTENSESGATTQAFQGLPVDGVTFDLQRHAVVYWGDKGNDPDKNSAFRAAIFTRKLDPSVMIVAVRSSNARSEALQKEQLFPESNGKDGQGSWVVVSIGEKELARKVKQIISQTGQAPLVITVDQEGFAPMAVPDGVPTIRYYKSEISPLANAKFALWFQEFTVRYGLLSLAGMGIELDIPRVGASLMNKPKLEGKPIFWWLRDPQNQPMVELAKSALVSDLVGLGRTNQEIKNRYENEEARIKGRRYIENAEINLLDYQWGTSFDAYSKRGLLLFAENRIGLAAEPLENIIPEVTEQSVLATLERIRLLKSQVESLAAELKVVKSNNDRLDIQKSIEEIDDSISRFYNSIRSFGKGRLSDSYMESAANKLAALMLIAKDNRKIFSPVFYSANPNADILGEFLQAVDYGIGTRDQHANFQHRHDGRDVVFTVLVDFVMTYEQVQAQQEKIRTFGLANDYLEGLYPDELRRGFVNAELKSLSGEVKVDAINHLGTEYQKRFHRDVAKLLLPDISTPEGMLTAMRIFNRAQALFDAYSSLEAEALSSMRQAPGSTSVASPIVMDDEDYFKDVPMADYLDMFRDYDYRYVGNKQLDPKFVYLLGLTWANMALEKARRAGIENRKVLVARDARKIEPELFKTLTDALVYAGLDVVDITANGPNAVTSYSWGVQEVKPLMSIFLTASHVSRPKEDIVRGFKVAILNKKGGTLQSMSTKEIKDISKGILSEFMKSPDKIKQMRSDKAGAYVTRDINDNCVRMNTLIGEVVAKGGSLYDLARGMERSQDPTIVLTEWEKRFGSNKPLKGVKVVVEASHTPSGKLAADTFRNLGAETIIINDDVQEVEGQHKADPSKDANLAELKNKMESENADFGIAFDLDGDRGAIVVPMRLHTIPELRFETLAPDNLIGALLPYMIGKYGYDSKAIGKNVGVIRDVLGTFGVNDQADKLGIKAFQTDAGYVFLKALRQKLLEDGYVIPVYGERSGHCWLDVTGEIENPVAVAVLFASMVKQEKYHDNKTDTRNPFYTTYSEKSIPYFQSPRFQPAFHPELLKILSKDSRNTTGWTFESGKNPPQAIIALGKDRAVVALSGIFAAYSTFDTPAGKLRVREFNTYKDPIDEGGLYRFADIVFEFSNGDFAGRFVFRASSNDPTFVCSYETPRFKGETVEFSDKKLISIGGVVLDWLERNNYALASLENIKRDLNLPEEAAVRKLKDLNLEAVDRGLNIYRAEAAQSLSQSTGSSAKGQQDEGASSVVTTVSLMLQNVIQASKMLVKTNLVAASSEQEEALSLFREYLQGLKVSLQEKGINLEQYITIGAVINGIREDRGKESKKTKFVKKLKGELVDIIDTNDMPVEVTEAGFTHIFGLRHRTSNAFVFTPDGKLFLQRRVHNKAEAKKFSIAGGHVVHGTTYSEAAGEELLQELKLYQIEEKLEDSLTLIGQEGQFQNDDAKGPNNEFRSLYAYVLTNKEWAHVKKIKDEIDAERAKRTEPEFEQWIEDEQKKSEGGLGEVWGYHVVNLSNIKDAESVRVVEGYSDGPKEQDVGFSSDLLLPLVKGTAAIKPGTPGIKPIQEIEKLNDMFKPGASSPMQDSKEPVGGIDFRALPMAIQPMGSFSGLNFKLPQLSRVELEQINIDSEMQQIKNMVQAGIIPSGQRIKELIAACVQKGQINSQIDNLLLCLADTFKLEEENASESSAELREALVIVDSQS